MRKIFLSALVAFMLVGCTNNTDEKLTPDKLFKDEISRVLAIENTSKKDLMNDMSNEAIVEIVDDMMKNDSLTGLYASYGIETQGIGTDASGKRIFCYKFPVEFDFDGGESEIKAFVKELEEIPSKISVSRFEITNKDEQFHVNSIVNFLGDIESTSISGSSPINFKKNSVEVNEEKAIVLRDFDVNLTVRPSNSDSSAVTIGLKGNDHCLYSDENFKHDVVVNFYKNDGKFYAEYTINGNASRIESFIPKDNIKFDVLSCKRLLADDYIDVDLTINNSSGMAVSVIIYDDSDNRVNIVSKSGNVDVVNE